MTERRLNVCGGSLPRRAAAAAAAAVGSEATDLSLQPVDAPLHLLPLPLRLQLLGLDGGEGDGG